MKGQKESIMQIAKLRELYSYDIVTDMKAIRDILNGENGWRLELMVNDELHVTMKTATGSIKIYKTLESLLNDVARIKGHEESHPDNIINLS